MPLAEMLVGRNEYRAAAWFVKQLRTVHDPPPQFIPPPVAFAGATRQHCVENTVKYCEQHPDCEPVKGFKLWALPADGGQQVDYVATVHFVTRHKRTGKYVDVTPPDEGDEGQSMIFVPSSRVYSEWTASEIADYCKKDMQIRMGAVCTGLALAFKQMTVSDVLYKSTPEELKLFICPRMSSVQDHMFDLNTKQLTLLLERFGATFMENDGITYCMIDASDHRSLHQRLEKSFSDGGMNRSPPRESIGGDAIKALGHAAHRDEEVWERTKALQQAEARR